MTTLAGLSNSRTRTVAFWLMGAVLVMGAGLCLHQIGIESLWLDEAAGLRTASVPFWQLFSVIRDTEVFPPFYFLALNVWINLWGVSEFALRLLSAFAAIISLAALYRLGRRLVGEWAGVAVVVLLATSPFFVGHAQEARPYSLVVLLTVVSFYGFLRLHDTPDWRSTLLYAVASLLLIYTHYHGFAVLAAQNLLWLFLWYVRVQQANRWILLRHWIVLQALIVFLFLPWGLNLSQQLQHVSSETWRLPPTMLTIYSAFVEYTWSQPVIWVVLYVAVLLIWSFVRPVVIRKHPANAWTGVKTSFPFTHSLVIVAVWLTAPHLIAIIASYLFAPVYLPRYTIAALPAFYLFFVQGVYRLFGGWLRIALIALVLALQGYSLLTYYAGVTRDQWREAAALIESAACPGDLVVFYVDYGRPGYDYYAHRTDLKYESFSSLDFDGGAVNSERIQHKLGNVTRFWLIEYQVSNASEVIGILEASGFERSTTTRYFHITVDLFETEPHHLCS